MGKQKNRNNKKKIKQASLTFRPGRQPTWPGPLGFLSSSPRRPEQAARWRAVGAPTPWPPSRPLPSHPRAPRRLHNFPRTPCPRSNPSSLSLRRISVKTRVHRRAPASPCVSNGSEELRRRVQVLPQRRLRRPTRGIEPGGPRDAAPFSSSPPAAEEIELQFAAAKPPPAPPSTPLAPG
jgi:hypothetical protein